MALIRNYNAPPPLSSQFSKTTTFPSTGALKSSFLSFTKNPFVQFSENPLVRNIRNQRRTSPIVAMSMEAGIGVMKTKLGMMSYFETDGKVVPVTVVGFREGNTVTQVKTVATDGYDSVEVGYRRVRDRKLTKPEMGHLEKAGVIPMRHLQEFTLQSVEGFGSGQKLAVDEIFKEGDLVDISGITIGRGFQDIRVLRVLFLVYSLVVYLFVCVGLSLFTFSYNSCFSLLMVIKRILNGQVYGVFEYVFVWDLCLRLKGIG